MPQFNFAYALPQILWLAAIFFVLYFFVINATLPKISKVVDERTATIDRDLSAAAAARDAALAAISGFDHVLADARTTAANQMNAAKAAAAKASDAKIGAIDATLSSQIAAAETHIAGLRTTAMAEIQASAAQTASDIVTKLTGASVPVDVAAKAVAALKV